MTYNLILSAVDRKNHDLVLVPPALVLVALMFVPGTTIDDHAKDGRPEEVSLLCSFYHDALRS